MERKCAFTTHVGITTCDLWPQEEITAANTITDADLVPDDCGKVEFSAEEIVRLHCLLLCRIKLLKEPKAPLEEKFELVRWIFTDPERDKRPFSFVNCVHVVASSPFSRLPYIGPVDPEEIRNWIAANLKRWFLDGLDRFPKFVQEIVVTRPEWVSEQLYREPQWLNRQIRHFVAMSTPACSQCPADPGGQPQSGPLGGPTMDLFSAPLDD